MPTVSLKIEIDENGKAKLVPLAEGLKDAGEKAAKAKGAFGEFAQSVSEGAGIGVGIAVVQKLGAVIESAAAAVPVMVGHLMDMGDNLAATSAKTGIGVEALQKFGYAGELANVSLDKITGGFGKFQKAMVEQGADTGKVLTTLGTSFTDLAGKSPEKQLVTIAAGFDKITDPAQRTYAAVTLFGKSGAEMLGLMNGGLGATMETAERLGFVMSNQVVSSAADLKDKADTLKMAWEGVQNNFAGSIVTAEPLHVALEGVTQVVADLSLWVRSNRTEIQAWVTGGLVFMAESISGTITVIEAFAAGWKAMLDIWTMVTTGGKVVIDTMLLQAQVMKSLATGDIKGVSAAWKEYGENLSKAANDGINDIEAHQKSLDSFVGVAEKARAGVQKLETQIVSASGKQHVAKEATDDNSRAHDNNAAATTRAAEAQARMAEAMKVAGEVTKATNEVSKLYSESVRQLSDAKAAFLPKIDQEIYKLEQSRDAMITKAQADFRAAQNAASLGTVSEATLEQIQAETNATIRNAESTFEMGVASAGAADQKRKLEEATKGATDAAKLAKEAFDNEQASLEAVRGHIDSVKSILGELGVASDSAGLQVLDSTSAGIESFKSLEKIGGASITSMAGFWKTATGSLSGFLGGLQLVIAGFGILKSVMGMIFGEHEDGAQQQQGGTAAPGMVLSPEDAAYLQINQGGAQGITTGITGVGPQNIDHETATATTTVPGYATGVVSTFPHLAMIHGSSANPEIVAPLDALLQSIGAGAASAGGGGQQGEMLDLLRQLVALHAAGMHQTASQLQQLPQMIARSTRDAMQRA